jgi:hypothetical protein
MSLLSINLRDFDSTFSKYIETTKYDVRKGMLYQLRHWLVTAAKHGAWSNDADIPVEGDPKLIAWLLSSSKVGGSRGGQKRPYRMAVKSSKGNVWKRATIRQAASGKHKIRMQWYNKQEARKYAINHFKLRHKSAGWIGAFIWRMAREIKGQVGGELPVNTNQRASRAIGAAYEEVAGTDKSPSVVSVRSDYDYARQLTRAKKENTWSAERVEMHIMSALNSAKEEIVPNMEQKIEQVLAKAARGITR